VYLAVLAAAGLFLFFVPETVSPRHRPTLRLAGLGIPELGRGEFVAAGVAAFSAFSVLGLFSALAPTFLGGVLHEGSHGVQGAVVFLLMAVGTVTQLLLSRFSSRRVVLAGLGLFLAALALIVAALSQAALALFLAGTVVGGAAVGAGTGRRRSARVLVGHGQLAGHGAGQRAVPDAVPGRRLRRVHRHDRELGVLAGL
jgi:hypothetical protein